MTRSSGVIKTPGYGLNPAYPELLECTWIIHPESNFSITFTEEEFSIGEGDMFRIYHGIDDDKVLLQTLNGSQITSIMGFTVKPRTGVIIEFSSDAIFTNAGFRGIYSIQCPRPDFDDRYILSYEEWGNRSNTFGDNVNAYQYIDSPFNVSCVPGYMLMSEDNVELHSLAMVCNTLKKHIVILLSISQINFLTPR